MLPGGTTAIFFDGVHNVRCHIALWHIGHVDVVQLVYGVLACEVAFNAVRLIERDLFEIRHFEVLSDDFSHFFERVDLKTGVEAQLRDVICA